MNTKGYENNEFPALLKWVHDNQWVLDIIVSIGRNNSKNVSDTDCQIVTTLSKEPLLVEVKTEEPKYVTQNKNITLDALSAFQFTDKAAASLRCTKYNNLKDKIVIEKYGTLYNHAPDIILKTVLGTNITIALNNHMIACEEFQRYIENTYPIRINPKSEYGLHENWKSAFYAIPITDEYLAKAIIWNVEQLQKAYPSCEQCHKTVLREVKNYSLKNFDGIILCRDCQYKHRVASKTK